MQTRPGVEAKLVSISLVWRRKRPSKETVAYIHTHEHTQTHKEHALIQTFTQTHTHTQTPYYASASSRASMRAAACARVRCRVRDGVRARRHTADASRASRQSHLTTDGIDGV